LEQVLTLLFNAIQNQTISSQYRKKKQNLKLTVVYVVGISFSQSCLQLVTSLPPLHLMTQLLTACCSTDAWNSLYKDITHVYGNRFDCS